MLISYSILRAKFDYLWLMFLSSRNKFDCQLQIIIPLSLSLIFWNRDFFSKRPRPNFQNRKRDFSFETKFSETETKTLKKLTKSRNREFMKQKYYTLWPRRWWLWYYEDFSDNIATFTRKDFQIHNIVQWLSENMINSTWQGHILTMAI